MSKNEKDVVKLRDKIAHLETDLATKESELVQERQIKEDLLNQSFAVAQSQDSERRYQILLKICMNLTFYDNGLQKKLRTKSSTSSKNFIISCVMSTLEKLER